MKLLHNDSLNHVGLGIIGGAPGDPNCPLEVGATGNGSASGYGSPDPVLPCGFDSWGQYADQLNQRNDQLDSLNSAFNAILPTAPGYAMDIATTWLQNQPFIAPGCGNTSGTMGN